ncbi:hypothetical protein M5K25_014286 [Dendrobium thyrsiflorum]|uniref:Reverse transcriptase zinc-binding domain-containing protein n=1 Tax=Dendrobium thyrsiflorum TaxID=117978 RepID=A0ABD0V2F8_DENTH
MSIPQLACWNVRGFNNPTKVKACRDLIKSHQLKFFGILEAKVHHSSLMDSWFLNCHRLFENEGSCNNFALSDPGRIWLKWDASVISFTEIYTSSQLIHGRLTFGSSSTLYCSVIYAANSLNDRKQLWDSLKTLNPGPSQPWMVLGDLNCCKSSFDKAGGTPLLENRLGELLNVTFDCGLDDLSSVGLKYTWFNQRTDQPIHIKLDRIMVNPALLDLFPSAYYKVLPSLCSDHSPLILNAVQSNYKPCRFLFKNYWLKWDCFWTEVLNAFSAPISASPISAFYTSIENVETLKHSLDTFSAASGLYINNNKSSIIFSLNNVDEGIITDILGIPNINTSLTYLGIPISSKRLKASHFQPLLSRLTTLLAGRIQFLKFTIANTIAYWIRGAIIPKGCRKSISSMCAKFLLHGNSVGNKLHLISWKSIARPKCKGGLGIQSIDSIYHAVYCSFICRLYSQPSLAGDWFKAKYTSPWKPPPFNASKCWKFISSLAHVIKPKLNLFITPMSKLSMFWDPWCNGCALVDLFSPTNLNPPHVSSYLNDSTWSLPEHFPDTVISSILGITIADQPCIKWDGSNNFFFNIFIADYYSDLEDVSWSNYLWHKRYALRHSAYAWMAILGKLKTADILSTRGINIPAACPFCLEANETHNHLFFECDFSYSIIRTLLPWLEFFLMRPNILQLFDYVAGFQNFNEEEKSFCFLTLCGTIYYIWRERNNRRFSVSWKSPNTITALIAKDIKLKVYNLKNLGRLLNSFPAILSDGGQFFVATD